MRAEKMKPNVLLSVGLIAIVLSTSTLLVDSLHAEVKCSCPTIDAEGEGETSCSTNESGGKCTIDYNLFANRELRAADLLRNILQTPFTTYAELNTNEALSQAYERDELTNQVLLYLLIAAVDQYSSHQDTVPDNVFSDVQSIVEEYQYSIEEAFHPSYFHAAFCKCRNGNWRIQTII